jgi:CheY-like chemotaxis protein
MKFFAKNFNEAVTLLKNKNFDIILTDLRMAGKVVCL